LFLLFHLREGGSALSKIAFVFPGQGAQATGMGRSLLEHDASRAVMEAANEILGYDLTSICLNGPDEELHSTIRSQPALFVTSIAAVEKMKAEQPDLVASCEVSAGLSLGEYTSLVFAGVMDFETGLKVVQVRAEAMQAAAGQSEGGMVSLLGLERQQVEDLCSQSRQEGEVLQIANLLCPGNIVVSGHLTACERVAVAADAAGAMKTIPLKVAGAFHTSLMNSAVEPLAAALAGAELQPPRIPVLSNVDATAHSDPAKIRELLAAQVVSPVLWEDSMRSLLGSGVDTFYEIGAGKVLRGLLRRIDRKITCNNEQV